MPRRPEQLVPVVLSGGSGSRLWPVSRALHPKPFMRLPDGESLLQKTYLRVGRLAGVKAILTVTNREYFFQTRDEFAKTRLAIEHHNLLEPIGRNTAPAIAMAALYALKQMGRQAVLLALPADHLVSTQEQFQAAVDRALALALEDWLVTFGVQARSAETGYGYIEADQARPLGAGYKVKSFAEKPDYQTAQAYVESGRYYWNSGMFCFRARTFLEELGRCNRELLKECEAAWRATPAATEITRSLELHAESFAKVTDISVDYALMEKSSRVAVIPAGFEWNDIGSWDAVSSLVKPDAQGNRVDGEGLLVDSHNTFVQSHGRLVAAVGVDNLMIVDTPDALLVANRDRAQDVKKVTEQLKLSNHESHKLHKTVHRPWGAYTVLEEAAEFKIKRIEVKPGASLSLQMHHHRSEHWVVVSGTAKVVNGDRELYLSPNESTYIPAGNRHRLENPGRLPLAIIEVQCGSYLGEDDIVRFEDRYGRAKPAPPAAKRRRKRR